MISLRPSGEHDALRRAAARHGGGLLALSPWRLRTLNDPAAHAGLRQALGASSIVFTSPAAVRAARALQPLQPLPGQVWCAVGAGTAGALRRAGIADVHAPTRMDSEGLLDLPVLQDVSGQVVGLVTAPGGRDAIAPVLRERGAQVLRAEVYAREPIALSAQAMDRLRQISTPLVLALSSGEALQRVLAAVPADVAEHLRRARVVAASERLAALAVQAGFGDVVVAGGPRPAALIAAALADRSGSM